MSLGVVAHGASHSVSHRIHDFFFISVPNAARTVGNTISYAAGRVWTFLSQTVVPGIQKIAQVFFNFLKGLVEKMQTSPDFRLGALVCGVGAAIIGLAIWGISKLRNSPPTATVVTVKEHRGHRAIA